MYITAVGSKEPLLGEFLPQTCMKTVIISLFKLDNIVIIFKTCKLTSFELNCSSALLLIAFHITYKGIKCIDMCVQLTVFN